MTPALKTTSTRTDWHRQPLADLIQCIVNDHHGFLEAELARLRQKLEEATLLDGGRNRDCLCELAQVLLSMSSELHEHLMKEEDVLFPYIVSLETAANLHKPRPFTPFGAINNPIHMMEREHDDVLSASNRMRELVSKLNLAGQTNQALEEFVEGLTKLEQDIHQHTHLENDILFPRARALESRFS